LAYWKTESGVVAMRLRCLHDDYDYSSASLFTVQDKGDILGAVVFATDRGDTHISLDRLKNATITAKDLRLRLQFEGAVDGLRLPSKPELNRYMTMTSGPVNIGFKIPYAVFDKYPVRMETGRAGNNAQIDIILYCGREKDIQFSEINEAVIIFALSVSTQHGSISDREFSIVNNLSHMVAGWSRQGKSRMLVSVPTKPLSSSKQKAAAFAKSNDGNPWKRTADRPQ
jgi:hypothetical protein